MPATIPFNLYLLSKISPIAKNSANIPAKETHIIIIEADNIISSFPSYKHSNRLDPIDHKYYSTITPSSLIFFNEQKTMINKKNRGRRGRSTSAMTKLIPLFTLKVNACAIYSMRSNWILHPHVPIGSLFK